MYFRSLQNCQRLCFKESKLGQDVSVGFGCLGLRGGIGICAWVSPSEFCKSSHLYLLYEKVALDSGRNNT